MPENYFSYWKTILPSLRYPAPLRVFEAFSSDVLVAKTDFAAKTGKLSLAIARGAFVRVGIQNLEGEEIKIIKAKSRRLM